MTIDSRGISHLTVDYPSFTSIIRDLSSPPWFRGRILSQNELRGDIIDALPSVESHTTHVVVLANFVDMYFFSLSVFLLQYK